MHKVLSSKSLEQYSKIKNKSLYHFKFIAKLFIKQILVFAMSLNSVNITLLYHSFSKSYFHLSLLNDYMA